MSEQVQRQVEKIEGISPEMLWTFLIVLVGLATLFLLGYKVIEVLRKEHERKVQRQQLDGQDITDQIANKVMEKLTPQSTRSLKALNRSLTRSWKTSTANWRRIKPTSTVTLNSLTIMKAE